MMNLNCGKCSNTDACVECAKLRIAEADRTHSTPDFHDLVLVKENYGGYW
jgi:hypothetical protein